MFDLSSNPRPRRITQEDIDRALERVEVIDVETANLLRAHIRRLEALSLAGELLAEEAGIDLTIPRGLE